MYTIEKRELNKNDVKVKLNNMGSDSMSKHSPFLPG